MPWCRRDLQQAGSGCVSNERQDGVTGLEQGEPTRDRRRQRYAALTDHQLVMAMRVHDPDAYEAFFVRFEPNAVRYARRLGIPDDVRDDCVMEAIEGTMDELVLPGRRIPPSVSAYIACAIRHRHGNVRRARSREERRLAALAVHRGDEGPVVAPAMSEHLLRLVTDEDAGGDDESSATRALTRFVYAHTTVEEREMMRLAREGATQAEIGTQLGLAHQTAAKRITRLRRRLTTAAYGFAETLPEADGERIRRLLRDADDSAVPAQQLRRSPCHRAAHHAEGGEP